MDYKQALAFAAASDSLCLFTGAGFSKHLSGGRSPDWHELLQAACDHLADPGSAKAQLAQALSSYPLEDCAQILELAFLREEKDLRTALCALIDSVQLETASATSVREFLETNRSTVIVTTNYDQLVERMLDQVPFVSHFPGKPIARRSESIEIFHIHGSTDSPSSLVVTTSDYYKFINEDGYFSQKMLTLLHESAVVILGYSLSDPNLKAVLSKLKSRGMRSITRGNIFYVTRGVVPNYVRDYYEAAYGLVVIENTEIDALLREVAREIPAARTSIRQAELDMHDVLAGSKKWTDDFLKRQGALFKILAAANTHGLDIQSAPFVAMLTSILDRKRASCNQYGAWDQYSHLADWLVHIGAVLDVRGTAIEQPFLAAVEFSMRTMSSNSTKGRSWYAYSVWSEKWKFLSFDNRILVKQFAETKLSGAPDALLVVRQLS